MTSISWKACIALFAGCSVIYAAAPILSPDEQVRQIGEDGTMHRPQDWRATRTVWRSPAAGQGVLPDVAIVASASGSVTDPWFTDPADALIASGKFNSVSIINAGLTVPSLLDLQSYDAVLMWTNLSLFDPASLGDNLADYVDGGGGVVVAVFANSSQTEGRYPTGRWLTHAYHLVPSAGGTTTGSATLGVVHAPGHPILSGVVDFSGGSSSFRPTVGTVIETGTVLAEWSDGATLVAVREDTVGGRVDLGYYPPSDSVLPGFWEAGTDGDVLLANALEYAANRPPLTPGDSDGDADVDADDFQRFEACVTGAGNGPPDAGCVTFDLDDDGDVDCNDWTLMELIWTGPPALPPLVDCNGNGTQDACDIADATSLDCTNNRIPDECEPDCNGTGSADSCDILSGTSVDCDQNGVPDECDAGQPDCNGNGTPDGCDIAEGTSLDCNGNDVPDSCDINSGGSLDLDSDGIPDECCTVSGTPRRVAVELSGSALPVTIDKNRYLSVVAGDPGHQQAIRVRLDDLPPPFDVLNARTMWVGSLREVSTNTGLNDATPPTITVATLLCSPHFADWSAVGEFHVYHWGIIPGGSYKVQVVSDVCPMTTETYFSPPLAISNSAFGDVAGQYDAPAMIWKPPDNAVDMLSDIVSIIQSFQNLPGSLSKTRSDLVPEMPDQIVDIRDAVHALNAFQGFPLPFEVEPVPCVD